jgi:hypothetical protein
VSEQAGPITPEQAVAIFAQLVNQTPALPAQVDVFREAIQVLAQVVTDHNAHVAQVDGQPKPDAAERRRR